VRLRPRGRPGPHPAVGRAGFFSAGRQRFPAGLAMPVDCPRPGRGDRRWGRACWPSRSV